VFYAVKANAFPPLLDALAGPVDGFEVSSPREIELAAARGLPMAASGPGKSEATLAALAAHGALVNVESVLELRRLARAAERAGRQVPVGLRVNPARVPLTGSLQMGGAATAFGIVEADIPLAVGTARTLPGVEVAGVHVHAVSNNLDADGHVAYVRWCLDWAVRTAKEHGLDLRVVDVGGGLGVPFEGEPPFELDRFAAGLAALQPPSEVRVVFEPGRWLVTDCGFYAAEVVDVKRAYGTAFAVLRGGINHFQLPTSWDIVHNFAVLPVEEWPLGGPRPEIEGPVTVVGELCTPEDTLARDVVVDRVRPGDLVVFPNAGSYGWEFAMHEFLGHPVAARIAV
jgi:diaminopimelate decarboxylase